MNFSRTLFSFLLLFSITLPIKAGKTKKNHPNVTDHRAFPPLTHPSAASKNPEEDFKQDPMTCSMLVDQLAIAKQQTKNTKADAVRLFEQKQQHAHTLSDDIAMHRYISEQHNKNIVELDRLLNEILFQHESSRESDSEFQEQFNKLDIDKNVVLTSLLTALHLLDENENKLTEATSEHTKTLKDITRLSNEFDIPMPQDQSTSSTSWLDWLLNRKQ